jgi:hypothetical protein
VDRVLEIMQGEFKLAMGNAQPERVENHSRSRGDTDWRS